MVMVVGMIRFSDTVPYMIIGRNHEISICQFMERSQSVSSDLQSYYTQVDIQRCIRQKIWKKQVLT